MSNLILFSSLYFAQGAMMSYFLTFNILYLGSFGYSEADVGVFQAILALPFVLKIFLGMLSDGVNLFGLGHRRPYIAIGLALQGGAMLALANVSPAEGLGAFVPLAFVASIGMALYDTCTDGLALDTTPIDQRGTVQGVMVGGRAAGILALLVGGGQIVEALGWPWLFYTVAIFALLPLPLVWLWRSNIQPEADDPLSGQAFKWRAFKAFGRPGLLSLAAVGFVYSLAIDGVYTFLSDHLKNVMHVSIGNVGLLIALAMVGRIAGALSNAWLTDRIGRKKSLWVAITLTSLGSLGLALGAGATTVTIAAIAGFLFGLAYGYYTAVYAAVAMDFSPPQIAASTFAIFMMFVNLGTVGGQALGGLLTEKLGFGPMCATMGAINLLNVALTAGVFHTAGAVSGAVADQPQQ
jgi:MFS transporter, PAT family, beta-lactamase induction signal transducer AmpG